MKTLQIQPWITVNDRGLAKITKKKPSIDLNEIAFQLQLSIPMEYFRKPLIKATMVLPELSEDNHDLDIDIHRIKDAISQETGIKVELSLHHTHEE